MATYHPRRLLPDGQPGAWSAPLAITYTQRDVLLYAVGIGCADLRHVYEQHPQFAVFPTFAIRWGHLALQLDAEALPPSPGLLTLSAAQRRLLTALGPGLALTPRPYLALAQACELSEAEVLAVPPARRQHYLQRVRA